jgi:hypothetical protein
MLVDSIGKRRRRTTTTILLDEQVPFQPERLSYPV